MIRVPVVADHESIIPQYARYGDAGCDLRSLTEYDIPVNGRVLVKTGLSIAIPDGYFGMVTPRSGLALKHGITVLNSPGIIDSGYRGEVGVILYNSSMQRFTVAALERVAQFVLVPFHTAAFESMSALPASERGAGGFGSTGVN